LVVILFNLVEIKIQSPTILCEKKIKLQTIWAPIILCGETQ
jgi:hypothetical protein